MFHRTTTFSNVYRHEYYYWHGHTWLKSIKLKIAADNPYKNGFAILILVMPLMAFITLISALPTQHKIILAMQAIGFATIGLFILSTFPKRRFDKN